MAITTAMKQGWPHYVLVYYYEKSRLYFLFSHPFKSFRILFIGDKSMHATFDTDNLSIDYVEWDEICQKIGEYFTSWE